MRMFPAPGRTQRVAESVPCETDGVKLRSIGADE
jgi:hypothetical protein